jgi:hypothetical protein
MRTRQQDSLAQEASGLQERAGQQQADWQELHAQQAWQQVQLEAWQQAQQHAR